MTGMGKKQTIPRWEVNTWVSLDTWSVGTSGAEVNGELECFRRSSVGQKLTEGLSVSEEAALGRS